MKTNIKSIKKTAFFLIEHSIVVLVIGILIAGVIQGNQLSSKAALESAKSLTKSSGIESIKNLFLWFESTSATSFLDAERKDNTSVSQWYSTNPKNTARALMAIQANDTFKPKYIASAINKLPAIQFDGSDDSLGTSNNNPGTNIVDSFSVFAVAQATATHEIDSEANSGTTGATGQKYLIHPKIGSGSVAGAGISMGTNGISFYEHSGSYMPPLLVYQASLLKPLVLLMEYNNKTPKLYINGTLVRTGLTSPKTVVIPYIFIGSSNNGAMSGYVGEVIVFSEVLKTADKKYVTDYLKKKWGIK